MVAEVYLDAKDGCACHAAGNARSADEILLPHMRSWGSEERGPAVGIAAWSIVGATWRRKCRRVMKAKKVRGRGEKLADAARLDWD